MERRWSAHDLCGHIDPGKKGAVAYLLEREGGWLENVFPIDDLPQLLHRLLRTGQPIRCCLEQVHAMPKQGVSSTFSFGVNFGWCKGLLEAHGISYQEVPPRKWKAEFGLNSDKAESIKTARKLFPEADLKISARARTDNDGMAEALLMAEYARRKL
jgi:crossover junction endodeoxyribonuclease RuvC